MNILRNPSYKFNDDMDNILYMHDNNLSNNSSGLWSRSNCLSSSLRREDQQAFVSDRESPALSGV